MSLRELAGCLIITGLLAGPVAAQNLNPERVHWSSVVMKARKFGLSATSRVDIRSITVAAGREELVRPEKAGRALEPTAKRLLRMQVESHLLGRKSEFSILLDSLSARAFQQLEVESGRRRRYKVQRFLEGGTWSERRYPRPGEAQKPALEWTDIQSGVEEHSAPVPEDLVTVPAGIIYVAAAAPLERSGDRLEILVAHRERIHRVEIVARGFTLLSANFVRSSDSAETGVRSRVPALHLTVRQVAARRRSSESLELLGLRGDLDLWIDPVHRYPLQIAGKVAYVGRVKIRLQEVEIDQDALLAAEAGT
jgi:hypothetical protein